MIVGSPNPKTVNPLLLIINKNYMSFFLHKGNISIFAYEAISDNQQQVY